MIPNHGATENTSRCDFQAAKHISMGSLAAIPRWMTESADYRRELLRSFIAERSLRIARWAKDSGVSANSIYNFLNGHSDGLDPRTYAKLARTAEIPVWRLNGETPDAPSPTTVWVSGHVQAGLFREAVEWDRSLWYSVDVPVPERFRKVAKALEVRGSSMNLEYREGSVVIWVDILDARPPRHGDHVIVYAYDRNGGIEATVKEMRVVDGAEWLWPRSTDPEHQSPINPRDPGEGIERLEIQGLVIGDYRQRVV